MIATTNDDPGRPKFGEKARQDLHLFFQIEDVPADEIPEEDNSVGGKLVNSRSVGARSAFRLRHEVKGAFRVHTFSY